MPSSRSSRPLAPAAHASAATRSASSGTARARTQAKGSLLLPLIAALPLAGCYLTQLADGQARLLWRARPIPSVIADPATDPALRDELARVEAVRRFAADLGLEVGRQYRSYADWPGDRVVTAVVATRPGEIEPAGFSFPLVGHVPYKGFFDLARAQDEAEGLRARGLDVCVVPVPAYSTLGWLADPVTTPMLEGGSGAMVETLIHELVHATVYVPSDADFDEGVATFIGEEGAIRFFAGDAEAEARERARIAEERSVARVLSDLRRQVAALYADPSAGDERAARHGALEAEARTALAALPGMGPERAAAIPLNDACLALAGTYEGDLDAYAALLAAQGGDLRALIEAVRQAARAPDPRSALGLPAAPPPAR